MSSNTQNSVFRLGLPVALIVLTLALGLSVASSGLTPGGAAGLAYHHLGLSPFEPLDHAVWGWLAKLLSFGGVHPGNLGWISLVCGAVGVALVYVVMTRLPSSFAPAPLVERKHTIQPVRAMGATFAALYLAVCLPFWIVSTRVSSATFDILLLLVSIYCLFRFRMSRRLSWAWTGCLVFTVGMTGFGSMFAIAPLYGLIVVVYLVQNGLMRLRNVLLLSVAVLLGLSPWLIRALQIMDTPTYEWREFRSLWDVLFYMVRAEYHGFKFAALKTGWLIILLVSVLPWFIVVVFRLGQNRKIAPTSRVGGFVLNVLLTAIGILIALGITFVSPWRYGSPQDPMVTPYLLISMWFGGLASFWYAELIHHEAGVRRAAWHKPLGWIILAIMGGTIVTAGIRNFPLADARPARLTQEFINQTIEQMKGRDWLITSGGLDENLALTIHERKLGIRTLSLPHGGSSAYLKYIATQFDDPRMKGLAQVGLVPLFSEWVATDPAAAGKIAIQNMPDLWFSAGKESHPAGLLYVAGATAANPDEIFASHQKTWAALRAADTEVHPDNPIAPYSRWIRSHTARVANNLGVYLEDAARTNLARRAYEEALTFDTNNISAKLNLYTLCVQLNDPATNALKKDLDVALKNTNVRRAMWSIAHHFGFVRRPEAYAERGMTWVISGKPNLGIAELNRARQMTGETTGLNLLMGGLYLQTDRPEESEKSYLAALRTNPTNLNARIGLLHVATLKQQYDEARVQLGLLRDLKAPPHVILMEEALIETASGNPAQAVKLLTTLTKDYPEHWLGWTTLALAAHEIGDHKTVTAAQTRLVQARALQPNLRIALATLSLRQGDRATARRHLEAALQTNPRSVKTLEMLITLEVQDRNRENAERLVQKLLSVNPRNSTANYVLGSLQLFNGQYALAEASYRAALQTARRPETLNDLAWCLHLQNRHKDAEPLSREATALVPRNPNAWDTHGLIHLKLGNLDLADQALQKATSLAPGNPTILFHVALLYEARGKTPEALQLAQQLITRSAELGRETIDEINLLLNRLRAKEQS